MESEKIKNTLVNYTKQEKRLDLLFNKYRSGRKFRVFINLVLMTFISAVALLLIFLLVERTAIQSEILRRIFSAILYGGGVCWLHRLFINWFKSPSDVALAVEIENSTKKFNSSLSSSIDFKNSPKQNLVISELMKKLTIAAAGEELKEEDIKASLKVFSRKRRLIASFAFLAILAGWYFLSPLEVNIGARRLLLPFSAISPWSNLQMDVSPKAAVAAVGESIEVGAVPSRAVEAPVVLKIIDSESQETSQVEMYEDANATSTKYVYNLISLQKSVDYQICCDRFTSEKYSIKVMPRPQIKNVRMTLYQPSYISSKPVVLPDNANEANILANSRIKIDVEADMKLSRGELCFSNAATQSCQIMENRFSYEFEIATSTSFFVLARNEIGLSNEKPVIYTINAKKDMPPSIDLLKPGCDVEFPTSRMLEVKAIAKDDFGVKTMVLFYRAGHREDWKPLNVKSDFKPIPECEIEFPWMLDTMAVQPGIKISYYMEAEDACQPKPNVASTPLFFVNMPSMQDVYKGQDKQQVDLKKRLDEFVNQQKMRSEALRKAYEEIKHEEKLDFETTKAIEEAVKSGERSQKQAEEILKSFENMQNSMENNPFTSIEAVERMQKIQELMDQVLDKDSKEKFQQLQKALQDMKLDPKDIEKYEEAFKLEDYVKGLERTIDLLEQVREQQKFESLTNSVEDLNERQKKIASETKDLLEKQKNGEELSKEEENRLKDLQAQQEKLNKDLQDIQKKSEEMLKEAKKEDFKNNPMLEDVKNMLNQMKNNDHQKLGESIKKDMQEKNLDQACDKQEKMLNFLEALKKSADQMKNMMCGSSAEQLDLSAYIKRALQVSKDQEKLYKEICDMPEKFMRGHMPQIEETINYVSVLQVLVKQQGLSLQEDLDNLVRTSFGVDPIVVEAIKDTQRLFSSIVKNLEDRNMQQSWKEQLEIIRRFNKLAADLMRAQDENGSGGSASSMSPMQKFKNLTQRQLSLYQQILKQKLMPGGSQELKQMAMEQRHIRESLEQLMREHRQQMNNLGRMNDVIEDMEDVETKILDPSLRQKVAEKQKSIYERMLKSQKALKNRDEEDEERMAEKAKAITQKDPEKPVGEIGSDSLDLSKDFTGDLREEFPESYKNLLNDYYKSLNIYGGDKK